MVSGSIHTKSEKHQLCVMFNVMFFQKIKEQIGVKSPFKEVQSESKIQNRKPQFLKNPHSIFESIRTKDAGVGVENRQVEINKIAQSVL